jgi:superfamily I DNA/RNA helicase
MIQLGLDVMPYAPGRPDVIFVDEAQDLTPLQLALVRSWGAQARWIVLVGDDEQCIFSFSGASPDAFLTPQIDDKYKRVLQQSYRVPRAVYKRAMSISAKISKKEPKVYHPRDFEGAVVETMANYKKAEEIIDVIKREIAEDKTVMYLCSCAYMLDPVKIVLREQGIPFHNPFRLTRGDWNPLAHGSSKRTTATDILVSFNEKGPDANFWTVQQFLKWAKYLKVGENGLIRKKGKAGLKALQAAMDQNMEGLETTRYVLKDILTENAINRALDRDFSWFLSNLTVRKISSFDFPLAVMQKGGVDTLFQRPKTIIGTIHSVKGAEADTVILAPDISKKAYFELQMASDIVAKRDEFYRLFYVGMTRAREKLILLRHAKQGGKAYFVGL